MRRVRRASMPVCTIQGSMNISPKALRKNATWNEFVELPARPQSGTSCQVT